ncbi:DNA polymerase III subunit chi [Azorhizobium oxalatiphilum]|uniref:DNA polymerase III subunit chi n=1 Tax=Azorhizobium oxalatiphilum TaxID=980631 RepID=A0A917CHS5_9HYPH|nr:DNA polymerase III subunit chi [Azorhizobium oxalatiphilum]GGF87238.1 DNA polymerase III subunit chi [Azorhizobium oxalatiphilum]
MTEVLFYHLERKPLEDALPALLEKSLERGWRCVVHVGSTERRDALDSHLWTYNDAGFLPHGTDAQPRPERQPVLLTVTDANPNGANVRFLVDGTSVADAASYTRLVHMFDGRDDAAVSAARERWREAKAAGHELTYWQQDENGRWVRKA